jgi:hypothetical protein
MAEWWRTGLSGLARRRLLSAAAMLPLLLLGAGQPVEAACRLSGPLSAADEYRGTAVRLDRDERELVFTTADGRELYGRNARIVGLSSVTAVSTTHNLTIVLRIDLRTGRAQASAVERELGVVSRPDRHTKVDPFRRVHTLSVFSGVAGTCD